MTSSRKNTGCRFPTSPAAVACGKRCGIAPPQGKRAGEQCTFPRLRSGSEGRVVLTSSAVSTSLMGSLSYVGVVTSPVTVASMPILPPVPVPVPVAPGLPAPAASVGSASLTWAHLGSDLQTLRVELQSLAQKSGVTIADLQSLATDSQTIAIAGFHFGVKSLNPVISELATAVAGGTSTSQAQTDFTALFSNSNVPAATITSTFTDLVQTIHDSAVTTTDLSTVAADEAAIQGNLFKLPLSWLSPARKHGWIRLAPHPTSSRCRAPV